MLFLLFVFLVSIGCIPSISGHKPRILSEKLNMCNFDANMQAFAVKAGMGCENWCP